MIIKLDERLSNMIAAGEVVFRPHNALKELLENSIDAKADNIVINILDYGLKEIKVIDNGVGMNSTDLKMAFLRHATSKIKTEFDLNHIKTLGFRGEAIPAIASVSKLMIKSREGDLGHEVYYEGGKFVHERPSALNKGTEVIVRDLFYNVPARLKHLKAPQTELSLILEVVDHFILANPKIAFKIIHNDKVLRQSFGNENYETLFQIVFGKDTHKDMIQIHKNVDNIDLNIYLGSPKITKARKNDIVVILNGRVIRNFVLTNAIIEGYHTRLMVNRYPIAVLDVKMDVSLIDVNVHPQKLEVRITNEYKLANLIKETIRSEFRKTTERVADIPTYKQVTSFEYIKEELELNLEYPEKEDETPLIVDKLPFFDYIGQYRGTYLIFQNEDGLYLIDQHAAEERIRYEIYYEKLGLKSYQKPLLFPILMELRPTEEEIIKRFINDLKDIGFLFEEAGPTGLYLKEIPIWLNDEDINMFIQNIISSLESYGSLNLSDLRDNLSKSIACKGAIKANEYLNKDEVERLIEDLRKTKNPYYCPHGRPILIFFSNYDIEKRFKRIVWKKSLW